MVSFLGTDADNDVRYCEGEVELDDVCCRFVNVHVDDVLPFYCYSYIALLCFALLYFDSL
jgi:hypothetical protein